MDGLQSGVAQQRAQAEHEHRVEVVEGAGWARDEDGWQLDVGDLRWGVTKIERIIGAGFVENTRAAYGMEMARRAEAKKLKAQGRKPA